MEKPKYQIVLEELKEDINTRSANESFYSERELAKLKNISRMTARKVIDKLAEENLIYRVVNVGTFVSDKNISQGNVSTFPLTNKNLTFKKILHNLKNADSDIAKELGIEFLESVLFCTFVTYSGTKIYSIEEVYVKYDHGDIYNLFEGFNYEPRNELVNELVIKQKVSASIVPIKYLPWMKVEMNTPIIQIISECYSQDGKKLIVSKSLMHPNNFNFYIK